MNSPDILLVIPSYRDGARLARFLPGLCAQLADQPGKLVLQVVDDGSPEAEQAWLADFILSVRQQYDFLQPLLAYGTNRGKGHAIRTGWSAAPGFSYVGFVDSDGAVPAVEVSNLIALARASLLPALFIGDRTMRSDDSVRRFWFRKIGSRIYNHWVRFCLNLDLPDTQCGLKIVPAKFYRNHVWHENLFAFDLELLLQARAARLPIVPQSIAWSEMAESSLGPPTVLALFIAAWRLRGRQRK